MKCFWVCLLSGMGEWAHLIVFIMNVFVYFTDRKLFMFYIEVKLLGELCWINWLLYLIKQNKKKERRKSE